MYSKLFLFLLIFISLISCGQSAKTSNEEKFNNNISISVPDFNPDSAYQFTENQIKFGPRIPNTEAHVNCGDYLTSKLKEFGAEVYEQRADLKNYSGEILKARNIIGSFQPENKNRILLFAHWDTRPFADQDPDPANHKKPIDGANDGAGACGVLLEIARQINIIQPTFGIDIIFFDAEDWGAPSFDENHSGSSGYCLGSDYWGKNPHKQNYTAHFGVLLDMVSAPNAQFYKEYYSNYNAPDIIRKVWNAALATGYGNYFVNKNGGAIEDDHVYVIKHRKIPCIDIIQHDPTTSTGFGAYWHTMNDNIDNVSKETMKAVGQTLLYVIYHEK